MLFPKFTEGQLNVIAVAVAAFAVSNTTVVWDAARPGEGKLAARAVTRVSSFLQAAKNRIAALIDKRWNIFRIIVILKSLRQIWLEGLLINTPDFVLG